MPATRLNDHRDDGLREAFRFDERFLDEVLDDRVFGDLPVLGELARRGALVELRVSLARAASFIVFTLRFSSGGGSTASRGRKEPLRLRASVEAGTQATP